MLSVIQWIQVKSGVIRTNKVWLLVRIILLRFLLACSKDPVLLAEKNETIKNKLRQALKIVNHELAETSCSNAPDQNVDYFQLIYECVETRNICLNFLNLKVHSLTGNDIDSAILHALLKGNRMTIPVTYLHHCGYSYFGNK